MTGRASIFRGKDLRKMKRGALTEVGNQEFEAARKRLAKMAGRKTASDGDVIEALSRGWAATKAYIRGER